ncbi:MAG TPA: FAD-binding oxidoreductase [Thermodesulfobacteriota bacterium]
MSTAAARPETQAPDPARLEARVAEVLGRDAVAPRADRPRYAVDGVLPAVVARPGTIEELSALLRVATELGAVVAPWGGGTKQSLGATPARVDLVASVERMNRVVEHEPADLTATFEAGIRLADANAHLGRAGQWLALDPPHADRATLGGVLAANASGPSRLRYGTARDLVIGIRVVHADGTITKGGAKVVKNVTGYDMNKLYIGSLGTLAVIAGVTVKLHPRPAEERTWVVEMPSLDVAGSLVARVLDSHLLPTAMEIVSGGAVRALPDFSALPDGRVLVAIAFGGIADEVASQVVAVRDTAAGLGVRHDRLLDGERQAAFWEAVRNAPARLAADGRSWAIARAALVVTAVPPFLAAAESMRAAHGLADVVATAEAGSGSARVALCGEPAALAAALGDLREVARSGGRNAGHLVVESAPAAVKAAVDVWGPVGPPLRLMQALKAQFDPDGRLNPGRFVGGI